MKALIQRVVQASVTVDGKLINSIGKGLCVLVGIQRKDKEAELEYLAKKLVNIRLFEDENGKTWEKSVKDLGYEILCVSQFTLAVEMKGNKPDFRDAMAPELSEKVYNDFLDKMRSMHQPDKIKGGVFGGYMQVHIQNDGPVTIPLETPSSLQDPAFLLKQERKLEAAKKREEKSKQSKWEKKQGKKEESQNDLLQSNDDSDVQSDLHQTQAESQDTKYDSQSSVNKSSNEDNSQTVTDSVEKLTVSEQS